MILEIITTPCETLVWAPTAQDADELRQLLADDGCVVLQAAPWELETLARIPDAERDEFDPARIINVEIGAEANDALTALGDAGHALVWHRWQRRRTRKAWGVPVSVPASGRKPIESALHFGLKIRGSAKLGLRISRDTYAQINKKSSLPRWSRELDPDLWDSVDDRYEDAEHRIYTDEWCAEQRLNALANYDLNMAYFAALDHTEFEGALRRAVTSQRGMKEVLDLRKWEYTPGLYIMVLDEYHQVYVGCTTQLGGVKARIQDHWRGTKQFDRLIWGTPETSILSIDSFRALDTTRIFAARSDYPSEREQKLLESIPPKFALNRINGGRDAVRFAALLGVDKVMKQRHLTQPVSDALPIPERE
ncbi:hypothetical protein PU630_15390 [Microbacterium horticulturae]|uniref:GIY-YIG domain-containing protein n=1 Tax=Microbacterium horticulturae TaxID=3028316 RepID=A0ABY8C190_9MICO|nr:hypothetical protein [Microbacterium sp. KACC 23027]WEG08608.1 hypothetical protein PU630_15390 [Microbacterium sp. KACC 23027]